MEQKELFSKDQLLKLILPLVVEQLLAVTVGMADMIMVSSAGEAAVSGISLVNTIIHNGRHEKWNNRFHQHFTNHQNWCNDGRLFVLFYVSS